MPQKANSNPKLGQLALNKLPGAN